MSPLIKGAKRFNYNNKIQKSSTINKSVQNIIKLENDTNENTHVLNIEGNITSNHYVIADAFNNSFLLVAEKFIISYKPYSLGKNIKNNTTPINFCHKPLKIPSKI